MYVDEEEYPIEESHCPDDECLDDDKDYDDLSDDIFTGAEY